MLRNWCLRARMMKICDGRLHLLLGTWYGLHLLSRMALAVASEWIDRTERLRSFAGYITVRLLLASPNGSGSLGATLTAHGFAAHGFAKP